MANFYPPNFENESKNVAIDFDGVLHNSNKGWFDGTCYGDPIQDSLDSLKILSKNYNLIIFSAKARSDRPLVDGKDGTTLIWEWLEKNGMSEYVSQVTSEKPRAEFYIDDNAIKFENWKDTLKFINNCEKF